MASNPTKLIRIKELAEKSGVSSQTIHYYLRMGLLPKPIKTAPNMAYYGPEYIEDIRFIKDLQQKRYLPLSVIKSVIEAKRAGRDIGDIQDMRLTMEEIFRPLSNEDEPGPITLAEFIVMTGMSAPAIEGLENLGLLMPSIMPEGRRFDSLDLRVARAVKHLLDLGLSVTDLDCYARFTAALSTEADVIYDRLFSDPQSASHASGLDVKETIDVLKSSLITKVYRLAALEHQNKERQSVPDDKPEPDGGE
jgi:DNA-binding transcriptional MerR regulator